MYLLTSIQRQLRDLGILVVQDASKCTHLAAPSILRTHKFVNALAYSPTILTVDFVTDCILKNTLLNPDEYLLEDPDSEKRYNFSLNHARARARLNKNGLLQGKTIYCVETIHGGFDAFKSIIETNGGHCALFRGRPGMMLGSRRTVDEIGQQDTATDREEVFLISGTDKSHVKLWSRFRTMAQDSRKVSRIVRADWLLDIAMSQEWRWSDSLELTEEDVPMTAD
jgi:hypothetical protein